MIREKESLRRIKDLCKEGKARLKKLRKNRRAYPSSEVIRCIYENRKTGVYKTAAHELFDIYAALNNHGLTSNERFSLNRRRKSLEQNLTNPNQ